MESINKEQSLESIFLKVNDEIERNYIREKAWGISICIDLRHCNVKYIRDPNLIKKFTIQLCNYLNVKRIGETQLLHYGEKQEIKGYSLLQLIETSLISGHFAEENNSAYLDIFSCKYFSPHSIFIFALDFFEADMDYSSLHYHLRRKNGPAYESENSKVEIFKHNLFGKGLRAIKKINKDEIISIFDGPIYNATRASELPNEPPLMIKDRAIQFEENKWRDSYTLARFANHSCSPNCGINGLFNLVAMRVIQPGEEITFDYDMTEDSDWKMECLCGNDNCRKSITGFKNLPKFKIEEYDKYISEWLRSKYNI